jgi:hypothetical protein
MKNPISIYTVGTLSMLYSIPALWYSIRSEAVWTGLLAAILLVGAVGLFLRRRWARFLVYFFSVAVVPTWLIYTITFITRQRWPYYTTTLASIIGLIPGVVLCSACVLGCLVVQRYFRAEKTNQGVNLNG